MKNERISILGLFISLALILSYIESLIPFSFGIPGIKLGLSNLLILILVIKNKKKDAIYVLILKILLTGFLFGSLSSIIYSLAGGCLSFGFMLLAHKVNAFSIRGISMIGGITHNLGQLAVAGFIVGFKSIVFYFPYLILAGLLTGLLIGVITSLVLPFLSKINYFME